MKSAAVFFALLLCLPVLSAAQEPLTVRPARKDITLTGYTRHKTAVTVSSEVSGKVLRLNYDVGQTVGDKPLAEIDPTFIKFQIESLRQSIQKVEAALKQNTSRTAYLKKEFERMNRLYEENRATTEVNRDTAAEDYQQSGLEQNSLKAEKAMLDAQLNELLERRDRHSIRAPKGWIMIRKMVEAGDLVAVSTPLAKVGDYRNLVIPLSVSAEELDAIRALPDPFSATLEGKEVQARLNWVNPEFDEQTRKLAIELMLLDYNGEHRGGLRFSLPLQIASEGLYIPKAAVINRYENPRVTLKQSGEVLPVMVLGESNGYLIVADDKQLPVGTELAPADVLFDSPRHPYTQALLSAIPRLGREKEKHIRLKGEVPTPINLPSGCVFHGRCTFANERCSQEIPRLVQLDADASVACHGVEEGRI